VDHLNEAERDAHFRGLALQNIARNPEWFAGVTVRRVLRYWWPVPHRTVNVVQWVGVGAYTLATVLAMLGLLLLVRRRRRSGPEWLVVTGVTVAWGLSSLSAVGLRHRLTGEPLLMVCAGLALATLLMARRPMLGRR
jgi:MYXO-CTERM domain-containing protein